MKIEMIAIAFLIAVFGKHHAVANSYGFHTLPKSEVPESIEAIANWSHYFLNPMEYHVSKEDIVRFVTKGAYHYVSPYREEMQSHGLENASIFPLLKTPDSELSEKQREILATYKKYHWLKELSAEQNSSQTSVDGAFI